MALSDGAVISMFNNNNNNSSGGINVTTDDSCNIFPVQFNRRRFKGRAENLCLLMTIPDEKLTMQSKMQYA